MIGMRNKGYALSVKGIRLPREHWEPLRYLMDDLGSNPEIGKEAMLFHLTQAYRVPEYDIWEAVYAGRMEQLRRDGETFRDVLAPTAGLAVG